MVLGTSPFYPKRHPYGREAPLMDGSPHYGREARFPCGWEAPLRAGGPLRAEAPFTADPLTGGRPRLRAGGPLTGGRSHQKAQKAWKGALKKGDPRICPYTQFSVLNPYGREAALRAGGPLTGLRRPLTGRRPRYGPHGEAPLWAALPAYGQETPPAYG